MIIEVHSVSFIFRLLILFIDLLMSSSYEGRKACELSQILSQSPSRSSASILATARCASLIGLWENGNGDGTMSTLVSVLRFRSNQVRSIKKIQTNISLSDQAPTKEVSFVDSNGPWRGCVKGNSALSWSRQCPKSLHTSNPFQHCGKPPLLLCLACFKRVARLATLVHSLEADKADWGWNWLVNLAVQVGAPWQKQLPVAKGTGSRKPRHAVRNKTKKTRSIAAKCRKMKCTESHRTSWHRFALLRCILCLWQGICGIDHQSAWRPSSRPFCEERREADVEHPGCMNDRVDEMHLDVMKQETS